jgi:putative PIN family toxin of toxin-antitoxin system
LIVVVDTNIWVSALQFGRNQGPPAQALAKATQQDTIAIADEIEAEVFETLVEKFRWPSQRAHEAIRLVLKNSIRYSLLQNVQLCRDPKDNMFLELAARARADYLVTGDKDLLVLGSYSATRIITPLEYISLEA